MLSSSSKGEAMNRLEWLKALRNSALQGIEQIEAGLHHLSRQGDEHMRDAAESWLEQHRSFATKLERRIRSEEARSAET